ncbi:MAG: N-acetylmuramoyl-L-alanine amidase [Phycisphaerae bacterium]|nr:N-acetylmuramoyl-L-alanine amidase [Phycisphaerae bacterium]
MPIQSTTRVALGILVLISAAAFGDLGGPTVHAPRQVPGALSGVVVYLEPGHGWYSTSSGWALQRPYTNLMIEDYGNLDQLNYLVHYAHNAGATVVPFRPAGYQPIEVVLDNDDPGVAYTGNWDDSTDTEKYYENGVTASGVPFRTTAADTVESATARYTPVLPEAGIYPVYCFTKHGTDRVLQTYRIRHAGGLTEIAVDHRIVGNGWIWLGEYWFDAGTDAYVEITNRSADVGLIIADAIRWGVGMGDMTGAAGVVSGHPRDEEDADFWALSEAIYKGVGFESVLYLGYYNSAAIWAAEMNLDAANNDRWRRVFLSIHSNASSAALARGTVALVHSSTPTLNQALLATILGDEIEADMVLLNDQIEFPWIPRPNPQDTGAPQISTTYNNDEFDATLVEVAFHDEPQDAALLRDAGVRAAVSRSIVQAFIKFLHSLPDSTVPLAFPPGRPGGVAVLDEGDGDVRILWQAPASGEVEGDPATGYVVYESADGFGFAPVALVGDVQESVISNLPVGEPRFFRVAATNGGGESMPSETLVVCRPATGTADVLIVNGYDRLRQAQNPVFSQGPGKIMTRPLWRQINSYDYVRQHAAALLAAEAGVGFSSCSNEAVQSGGVSLSDYAVVDWLCGEERNEDFTFNAAEQAAVTAHLAAGGAVFISGAQVGYDLVAQQHGPVFFRDVLGAEYVEYYSNTYHVAAAPGGLLDGLPAFDFDPANGAAYRVHFAERITPRPGAMGILDYVGGTGGTAGIEYDGVTYRVVLMTAPLETITSDAVRGQVMQRVLARLRQPALRYDANRDGDVDLTDVAAFATCLTGPSTTYPAGDPCRFMDGNDDGRVDLVDFAGLQAAYAGP